MQPNAGNHWRQDNRLAQGRSFASQPFLLIALASPRSPKFEPVGVDIHDGSHGWQTHIIEFFAIGTAVLPLEQGIGPERIADPIMVLRVNE